MLLSVEPFVNKLERSIFSGDAKRGTLKIAFIKNITNRGYIDTVLT